MQTGFYFDELEDYKKNLLQKSLKSFPDETNKFLKCEQKGLQKEMQKTSKWLVKKKMGYYHKSFKIGKIYKRDGNLCGRAYNNARHAHLIETGHKNKDGTWQEGKHVMEISKTNYKEEFYKNVEEFLFNGIEKKKKK